jgi:hypothetical protein
MAINPSGSVLSDWFQTIIGDISSILGGVASSGQIGSLLAQLATTGIAVGSLILGLKNDSILFAGVGFSLSLLVGDFINIFTYIYSSSPITAVLMFSPITVLYVFTCLEWVRGMP